MRDDIGIGILYLHVNGIKSQQLIYKGCYAHSDHSLDIMFF